ncbi:hypothetical protein ACFWN5_44815 [Streptomyces sp. NPDC058430]|uniref:hypothetical protein n=1 Tax=Streptomyces sp. NPDC058430 TaxID=3346495 RepID=UPI0036623583
MRQERRWNNLPRGARAYITFVVLSLAFIAAVTISHADDPPTLPSGGYCSHHPAALDC